MYFSAALALYLLITAPIFALAANIVCKSQDGQSRVTLTKLKKRHYVVNISIEQGKSEPIRISSHAHVFGENDGKVILEPLPASHIGKWVLTLKNELTMSSLNLRFAAGSELAKCASALQHTPDKPLDCSLNDVNDLLD